MSDKQERDANSELAIWATDTTVVRASGGPNAPELSPPTDRKTARRSTAGLRTTATAVTALPSGAEGAHRHIDQRTSAASSRARTYTPCDPVRRSV
jgi:hypothetical protein